MEDANDAYKHVLLQYIRPGVLEVRMNRPEKRNAYNNRHWKELGHCFTHVVPHEEQCRCVVLTGAGKLFSAGIDLQDAILQNISAGDGSETRGGDPVVMQATSILREGGDWQKSWMAINTCNKPVIAAVHTGCFGAALEMICFADVRFCTEDTVFQAPEVDIGLAADIGGNQMFPKIVGNDSLLRELQLSGRRFTAAEALAFGLVSRVCKDHAELMAQATELAVTIASKSPVAVLGVKNMLNYTRDHSVDDSLKYGLTWNAAMVQSEDMKTAGQAFMMKQTPVFPDIPSLVAKSKL